MEVVDLDLRSYVMCSDLLDLLSVREFVELAESDG